MLEWQILEPKNNIILQLLCSSVSQPFMVPGTFSKICRFLVPPLHFLLGIKINEFNQLAAPLAPGHGTLAAELRLGITALQHQLHFILQHVRFPNDFVTNLTSIQYEMKSFKIENVTEVFLLEQILSSKLVASDILF